jgi:septal ring factor EnvC (AmiA/AmiB activator)
MCEKLVAELKEEIAALETSLQERWENLNVQDGVIDGLKEEISTQKKIIIEREVENLAFSQEINLLTEELAAAREELSRAREAMVRIRKLSAALIADDRPTGIAWVDVAAKALFDVRKIAHKGEEG